MLPVKNSNWSLNIVIIIFIISYQEQPKVVLNRNRKLTVLKIHRPSDRQTDGQTNVFDCSDSNAYEEFYRILCLEFSVQRRRETPEQTKTTYSCYMCGVYVQQLWVVCNILPIKKYPKKIKLHFPVDLWPEGWTDNPTVVMVVHGNERLFNASISAVLSRTDSQITIGWLGSFFYCTVVCLMFFSV